MRLVTPLRMSLGLLVLASLSSSVVAEPGDLSGLWGAERTFGPAVQGSITIDGRTPDWIARVSGYEIAIAHTPDAITLALPDGAGDLHGTLAPDGGRIRGVWIQPMPVMSDYRFATPIELTAIAPRVWRGTIKPLVDQLSLYVVFTRAGDVVTAAIRNPEANLFAHDHFRVTWSGNDVVLTSDRGKVLRGTLDPAAGRLSLRIPLGDTPSSVETFELTRRARGQALGYYPRTPPPASRAYRPPVDDGDGWSTADAATVGFDDDKLAAAIADVAGGAGGSGPAPYPQAIVVARRGKLVLEEYFGGFTPERPHDLRSAGKSFTSMLAGIAVDRGALSLSTPVVSLFPDSPAARDAEKRRITLEHLLTMTSGLACDDTDPRSPGNELTMFAQKTQPDYYAFMLALPVVRPPGAPKVAYCSAGLNLVGGVVARATHRSFLDAFEQDLARPLGFHDYALNLTPAGDLYGAGGLYVRPRDALKLGQVMLDRGRWNGRRIVSEQWVDASTRRHASYNPQHGYGLAWHLFEVTGGGRAYREYEAQGNGGQLIIVVPALALTVVFGTGNYSDDMTDFERAFLARVIAAIKS